MTSGHALCSAGPDVVTEDVIATHAGHSVPVRRYLAPDERAVLVYAHGGGWVTGDLEYADEVCRFLARDSQCTVVSVDYRLAPEHPFPAGLDDVLTAYQWACAAGRPVALGGDSSGGNLAAAAALLLRDDGLLPAFAGAGVSRARPRLRTGILRGERQRLPRRCGGPALVLRPLRADGGA